MKSAKLSSDSVMQQGKTIPTQETGQVEMPEKLPLRATRMNIKTIWGKSFTPEPQKITGRASSDLQPPQRTVKNKRGEKADIMRAMSQFVAGISIETGHNKNAGASQLKSFPERIESLVSLHGLSYYELAKEMGVTRTTVHAVRKGKREATRKFILKLETAEQRLGASRLAAVGKHSESMLVFAANSTPPVEELMAAPDELSVRIKGTTANPNPEPVTITLRPPPMMLGIRAIIEAHTQNKCNELLRICLPSEVATNEWIENMSPTSYIWALQKSIILILGREWKQELTRILSEAEAQRPNKPN
jgi:transcriptional regulator with XRE-family HTH domain